jgi:hypothetical protein
MSGYHLRHLDSGYALKDYDNPQHPKTAGSRFAMVGPLRDDYTRVKSRELAQQLLEEYAKHRADNYGERETDVMSKFIIRQER